MAILSANQVLYQYRNKYQTTHVLKGLSCSFDAGKIYALTGPSGSGKTTFLSLLAGLDCPSGGNIFFEQISTEQLDRDQYRREHVSVIYQNFNLFSHLTMLENAAYPLYMRNVPRSEAEKIASAQLLAVGLRDEQFKRFPYMLSGGEQQRTAIARALSAGSEIILGDEPTGNLDQENSRKIMEILKNLAHKEGKCVILVTHDLMIAQEADEIYNLRDGVLESTGKQEA